MVIPVLVLALILVFASTAPASAAAKPSVDRATAKRLSVAVDKELRRQVLPGAIVGVKRDGRAPWIVARGLANLQTRRPMRTDEHVRIGSVTKAFVTTLLLRLVQEGRLSLDAPISRYVPGVPGGDSISLRELANMTSGIADNFANPEFALEYLTG
jgi:D-alanyl-D-alanine carboxypeptidase